MDQQEKFRSHTKEDVISVALRVPPQVPVVGLSDFRGTDHSPPDGIRLCPLPMDQPDRQNPRQFYLPDIGEHRPPAAYTLGMAVVSPSVYARPAADTCSLRLADRCGCNIRTWSGVDRDAR